MRATIRAPPVPNEPLRFCKDAVLVGAAARRIEEHAEASKDDSLDVVACLESAGFVASDLACWTLDIVSCHYMSAPKRAVEAYRLALKGRRRRAAGRSTSTRAEIASLLAENQHILEAALDRTPFVPPDDVWPDTGVVTREEAAIMRRAARNGLNIDFIPLNARIRPLRDNGAA